MALGNTETAAWTHLNEHIYTILQLYLNKIVWGGEFES
jgi:hypothetical protein